MGPLHLASLYPNSHLVLFHTDLLREDILGLIHFQYSEIYLTFLLNITAALAVEMPSL